MLITATKSKSNLLLLFPNKHYHFQVTKPIINPSHSRFDFHIGYCEDNKLTNSVEVALEQHIMIKTQQNFFAVNTAYQLPDKFKDSS